MMEYMGNLKQSMNQSRLEAKDMSRADRADRIPEFASQTIERQTTTKQDFFELKQEVELLKEKMKLSMAPPVARDLKFGQPGNVDAFNRVDPKSFLPDGVGSELALLKNRSNNMALELDMLANSVRKLEDDRSGKVAMLERKLEDDLESFKIFKERVQIEVSMLKEKAKGNIKTLETMNSQIIPPLENSQVSETNEIAKQSKANIDQLTKMHESFKKEAVTNFTKIFEILSSGMKKRPALAGMTGKSAFLGAMGESLDRSGMKLSRAEGYEDIVSNMDAKLYEQEMQNKRSMLDQKKELVMRIDSIQNVLDDVAVKTQKLGRKAFTQRTSGAWRRKRRVRTKYTKSTWRRSGRGS